MLNSQCEHDDQCSKFANNTVCLQVTPTSSYCKCKDGYQSLIQPDYIICVHVPTRTSSVLYPSSVASIIVLFVILAFLLCFVIRLFSKTRCRHRPSTDMALTPIIKLDGKGKKRSKHLMLKSRGSSKLFPLKKVCFWIFCEARLSETVCVFQ